MKTNIKTAILNSLAICLAAILAFIPTGVNNVPFIDTHVAEAKSITGALSTASLRSGKSSIYISKWNINPAKCNITVCMNEDKEIDTLLTILDNLSLITNTCEANKVIKKADKYVKWKKAVEKIIKKGDFNTLGVKLTLVIAEDFSSDSCKTYNKVQKAYKELKNLKKQYPTRGLKITFSASNSKYKVELQ